jgi:cob(I)alamin adenosyltransferase
MKIYTKTGDQGTTSLLGGTRVAKTHLRLEAYGTLDELNAFLGLVRDQPVNEKRSAELKAIQDRLFTLGSHLAAEPSRTKLKMPDLRNEDIQLLEEAIDRMETELPPLRNFILPGGHTAVSMAHVARTVCRRAERQAVALHEQEPIEEIILKYLNRLSDYLFVLARKMGHELGVEEQAWKPREAN